MVGERKPVALVTGASGGIGSAIGKRLATDGYRVVLHYYRHGEACKKLQQEIVAAGGEALCYGCDLQDRVAIRDMFARVQKDWGNIDLLVNNAAIAKQQLFTDMTEQEWQAMWQTNVSSAIYCSQQVLPGMIHEKRGKIINISSVWGMVGASCEVAYSTTKAALIGFTKALAKEVGPSGITVNCVAPGVIDTAMNRHLSPADMAALCEETPLGCIGTPCQVAGVVGFLASQDGDFITGQVISPNGGFVIS